MDYKLFTGMLLGAIRQYLYEDGDINKLEEVYNKVLKMKEEENNKRLAGARWDRR